MHDKQQEQCDGCRFWSGIGHSGSCRRYPPTLCAPTDAALIVNITQQIVHSHTHYPATAGWDWCGEFKAASVSLTPASEPTVSFEEFRRLLSARGRRGLHACNIYDWAAMKAVDVEELTCTRNVGLATLLEITSALSSVGAQNARLEGEMVARYGTKAVEAAKAGR